MIILGLAVATSEHHAAALVIDGQPVAAAEEERFNGVKHYGWSSDDHPGANLLNAPGLRLRDVVCRESVAWCLASRGLTMGDVDVVAVNGIPHRFRGTRAPVVRGKHVYVPHHLAHASVAARTSPYDRCHVLTVDGRGEYETAALFQFVDGHLRRLHELRAGGGCSIGGVYETVTRALGFGAHGQGQTMALASFARGDAASLADVFAIRGFDRAVVDEHALQARCRERLPAGATPEHEAARALAADLQAAFEDALVGLASAVSDEGVWALAGGCALNCRGNSVFRDRRGARVWVPSNAHDGGTALGAALEAAAMHGEPAPVAVERAGFGPSFGEEACAAAIRDAGLWARATPRELPAVAARIADGQVVGWFDGPMEYGPRALGHRSIVAHPGAPGVQDRVNRIKDRQAWRPFGPSVLAEHSEAWFEDSDFGPFMTFTAQVRPERVDAVRGVVHVDGSTRPQRVDEHAWPAWRGLIGAFHEATGVPMVLNTSFNGRAEPIVCTPGQAIASAQRLGLDALSLGPFVVELGAR